MLVAQFHIKKEISQLFPLFCQSLVSDTALEIKFIPFFLINKFVNTSIIYYTLHNHRSIENLKIGLQDTVVVSIWPTRVGFSKNKNEVAGKSGIPVAG